MSTPDYLDANHIYPWYTSGCTLCGALIHDKATHDAWHNSLPTYDQHTGVITYTSEAS